GLPFPAPVLHDLRRQLDEIPGDVRPSQAPHLHPAQAVMQQVTELVKNGLDLTVGQHRGLAAYRWRQISADQAEMRLQAGQARQESVHPRATPLVLARVEVGVKGTEQRTLR